jgi:hypothetical protein
MAFRGEMHHGIRVMKFKHLAHRIGVGNISPHQLMARVVRRLLQRILRSGVGHLVDVHHDMASEPHEMPHHGGTDEPAASGQQDLHQPAFLFCKRRVNIDAIRRTTPFTGVTRRPGINRSCWMALSESRQGVADALPKAAGFNAKALPAAGPTLAWQDRLAANHHWSADAEPRLPKAGCARPTQPCHRR